MLISGLNRIVSPIVYLTWILALGISAQWLAWRFKFPSILLLLALGFGFGRLTGVRIDDFLAEGSGHGNPLLSIVGLFVAIILFEGGLTLKFRELKESGLPILRLCTVSVVLSFALTTFFMMQVLGYDIRIAALVGAILTVTGPTVIAPLLQHVKPTRKMASIIKWEGIVVDPLGAILAVLVFKLAMASNATAAWAQTIQALVTMALVGVVGGFLLGRGVVYLLKRHLVPDFLQPVFLLAVLAVAFTVSNLIEKETGLLTATVMGIVLANQHSVSVRHILAFKENLRTLIISSLFLILSGRIELADLSSTLDKGLLLLAFLVLVGRPLSVYLSLAFSKWTNFKERTLLAFLAPRGIVAAAVTSIFALEFEAAAARGHFGEKLSPLIAAQSNELVALVFLVIVGSVTIYGLGARPLARWLGLAAKDSSGLLMAGAGSWARVVAKGLHDDGIRVLILDTNFANVAAARLLGLEAVRANILSETAEEELDLYGLGHLIAVTPNDEVNSMAAQRFAPHFSAACVWQLTPSDRDEHHTKSVADDLRSRICFQGGPDYQTLSDRVEAGAQLKKIQITAVFDFKKFQDGNPNVPVLFLQDASGLRPAPADLTKVAAGTAIFVLGTKTLG